MSNSYYITARVVVTVIDHGLTVHANALKSSRTGLAKCQFADAELDTYVGEVADLVLLDLPAVLAAYDSRNNRLACSCLQQDGLLPQLRCYRQDG